MRQSPPAIRSVGFAVTALATIALFMAVPAQASAAGQSANPNNTHGPGVMTHGRYAPMHGKVLRAGCGAKPEKGSASCDAQLLADASQNNAGPQLMSAATGYGPADLQSAYGLAGLKSGGATVAIVDAMNDPNAAADLAAYRGHFGLPTCTVANGCFKQINQQGATSPLPANDYGWAEEISLDLDMVSAICPDCHITLVEANSANLSDLATAEDTAAGQPGVVAISNSYGGTEDGTEVSMDSHYNHPGVAITASTGDSGYGASYPATSPHVTAVGGTTLNKASTPRGWTETAWSGAGSGCSKDLAQPSFQTGLTPCTTRAIADVSANADPNTGVAVYDTANSCGSNALCDLLIGLGLVQGADGWVQVGGTSESSPIIASVYALAGNAHTIDNSYPYGHSASLNDVTSGSNGSCTQKVLCNAGIGWDGPTGLGTPNGAGAF
ncbi:MAG TPA: S53 family peptidase [Marmoricola sp.]|nr:S53 family peptidase [Marmoricola sp.]